MLQLTTNNHTCFSSTFCTDIYKLNRVNFNSSIIRLCWHSVCKTTFKQITVEIVLDSELRISKDIEHWNHWSLLFSASDKLITYLHNIVTIIEFSQGSLFSGGILYAGYSYFKRATETQTYLIRSVEQVVTFHHWLLCCPSLSTVGGGKCVVTAVRLYNIIQCNCFTTSVCQLSCIIIL